MSTVHVVDIKRLTDEAEEETIARFVIRDGAANLVELRADGRRIVEKLLQAGVPGSDGRILFPRDGLAYLQRLPYLLHATYLWATEVYEMDAGESLIG